MAQQDFHEQQLRISKWQLLFVEMADEKGRELGLSDAELIAALSDCQRFVVNRMLKAERDAAEKKRLRKEAKAST